MMVTRKPRFSNKVLPGKKPRVVKKPVEPRAAKIVKKRVPFSMSSAQSIKMRERMFNVDKYNTRQKSQWISEALTQLLNNPNYLSVVIGVIMAQRDPTDEHIVLMDEELKIRLDDAYLELRKVMRGRNALTELEPQDEIILVRTPDPMGAILRAAVMNRINPIADEVQKAINIAKAQIAELEAQT